MLENSEIYKVANRSMVEGEEDLVFQNPTTLNIIEPSEITKVAQHANFRLPNIDEDMDYILRHMNHQCYIIPNDNGKNRHTLVLD
jgi:hypothetical protein